MCCSHVDSCRLVSLQLVSHSWLLHPLHPLNVLVVGLLDCWSAGEHSRQSLGRGSLEAGAAALQRGDVTVHPRLAEQEVCPAVQGKSCRHCKTTLVYPHLKSSSYVGED